MARSLSPRVSTRHICSRTCGRRISVPYEGSSLLSPTVSTKRTSPTRNERTRKMKHQTLQYYMHDGPSAFRFELAGDLTNEAARRLDQDWRTASSVIGDRALIVDMTYL